MIELRMMLYMRKTCCLQKKLVRKRPSNYVYSIIKTVNKTVNKYNMQYSQIL